jgi:TM2 domain-containing membrane protein YozV
MEDIKCPSCGSPNVDQIDWNRYQCPYCSHIFVPSKSAFSQTPQYFSSQPNSQSTFGTANGKNRMTAAILAFLLGGLGVHNFYLGNIGKGILDVVFCWTYIPALLGFIEGIMLITQSDEEFAINPKLLF